MLTRLLASYLLLLLSLLAFTGGCKDSGNEPAPADTTDHPIFRKPNLYLYPANRESISVHIHFPYGGRVIESEPSYGSGWTVDVTPEGIINDSYRFLFYEAQTAGHFQLSEGWLVSGDTLGRFFAGVLRQVGFIEPEIRDFVEYWIPNLRPIQRYVVFPQSREQLDRLIEVRISPEPDRFLRMTFVIEALTRPSPILKEPNVSPLDRTGFVAAEWGVVIK